MYAGLFVTSFNLYFDPHKSPLGSGRDPPARALGKGGNPAAVFVTTSSLSALLRLNKYLKKFVKPMHVLLISIGFTIFFRCLIFEFFSVTNADVVK